MDLFIELLKIILPASLVLYAMYLTINSFLNKDFQKKLAEIKLKNTDITLNIRLQAYERVCLFLERISLQNLIPRVNAPNFSAGELQQILLTDIRNEFSYNLSQQIYMSDQAWNLVRKAMEENILLINNSASAISPEAKGLELIKGIFENVQAHQIDPVEPALRFLKDEVRVLYN